VRKVPLWNWSGDESKALASLLTCAQGLLGCPTAEDRPHAPGFIWQLAKPCSSEPRCGCFSAHSDRKTGGGLDAWQVYCLAISRRGSGLNPLAILHADQTLFDEVPQAYKDASRVVEVVHRAVIALKVAPLPPLGVIKG
jgi:tRNA-splicing ligase RtcB